MMHQEDMVIGPCMIQGNVKKDRKDMLLYQENTVTITKEICWRRLNQSTGGRTGQQSRQVAYLKGCEESIRGGRENSDSWMFKDFDGDSLF